jgi:YVTN family beta-propeller protein
VALNFDNELGVIDVQSLQLVAQIPVGNAPFGVVINGNLAYVSNRGGRRAKPNDFTNLSAGTRRTLHCVLACRVSKLVWPEPLTGPALCMTVIWPYPVSPPQNNGLKS